MSAAIAPTVEGALMDRAVMDDNGCLVWQGVKMRNGYGVMGVFGEHWLAHRLSYAVFRGPIPDEMTVDHLCFNPPCINPDHLRLLSHIENSLNRRGTWSDSESCRRGHAWTPKTTRVIEKNDGTTTRTCRTCHNERRRERRRAAREAAKVAA